MDQLKNNNPKQQQKETTYMFVRPPPWFDSKISISLAMTFHQTFGNDNKTTNEAVNLP